MPSHCHLSTIQDFHRGLATGHVTHVQQMHHTTSNSHQFDHKFSELLWPSVAKIGQGAWKACDCCHADVGEHDQESNTDAGSSLDAEFRVSCMPTHANAFTAIL